MLRPILWLCSSTVAVIVAGGLRRTISLAPRAALVRESCTVEALGRAAAADTSRLRRVRLTSPPPSPSAEGGETTAYYDGDKLRVIVIQYYGETGMAVVRYYLAGRDQYLVQREELRYTEPISVQSHSIIATRIPSTVYVCGRTSKASLATDNVAQLRSDLESVLAQLRRSPGGVGDAAAQQSQSPLDHSSAPPKGFIPDSITAVRVAEAVLSPIYSTALLRSERPLQAILSGDTWTVKGSTLHGAPGTEYFGGVAVVEISKTDGRILRVSHGQ
jgi:NTF2 fold immunity protein